MTDRSSPPRRFARELAFIWGRFSPEGAFGLHLTIGLVVMILGFWIFAEIAETLPPQSSPDSIDQRVATWFHTHRSPGVTVGARVVTTFGSVAFLIGAFVALSLLFLRQKAWNRLMVFSAAMIGGSLLNIILKHFFHRQRPVFENPLVTLTSYGFPSGHTMGATIFYGVLALFAIYSRRSWAQGGLAVLTAGLIVMAIGLTRMYLGAHYLTDVLAAFAAGAVWLAFCWAAVESLRKHRRNRVARAEMVL